MKVKIVWVAQYLEKILHDARHRIQKSKFAILLEPLPSLFHALPMKKIHRITGLYSFSSTSVGNLFSFSLFFLLNLTNRQHPHKLSSKNKISEGGYYKLKKEIRGTEIIEFKDLGIVFVKREHMRASLEDRKLKKVDPTRGGWDHINKKQHIDLHSVRLCFQVCMETPNEKYKQLACVISNKILDKKSHGSLNIDETSLTKAKVSGGKRFFIFCSRVKRDDISILLYEKDKRNTERRVWEKEINFRNSPTMRVHHQYAISFVMPPYKDTDISEPCKAYFQLYRPSDEEYSDPIQFEFMPVKMKHCKYFDLIDLSK